YNIGNSFREDLFVGVHSWFKLVGINVVDDGVDWSTFLDYLFDDYNHLGLFAIGWAPDFLDPYNMLDPLFNPASSSNSAQVNDAKLNTMMAACLAETDDLARNILYQNIQGYMTDYGFFHIPLYHSKITYVHRADIKGIPYNAMGAFYAYPIHIAPTVDPLTKDELNILHFIEMLGFCGLIGMILTSTTYIYPLLKKPKSRTRSVSKLHSKLGRALRAHSAISPGYGAPHQFMCIVNYFLFRRSKPML
ncbi:MAG: hypothetical protein ACTSR5_16110, partial [Promethearchaeota archaeon]